MSGRQETAAPSVPGQRSAPQAQSDLQLFRENPGRGGPKQPGGKKVGVCVGGAAKLPVPRSRCFRQEPEDAMCGRNSGPTDGRTAARDGKVSSGVAQTVPLG